MMERTIQPRLISYNTLRTILGLLGFLLPVILPLGVYIFGMAPNDTWQPSISDFYYTNMGDVFVGILWGFGLFLIAYKGYPNSTDNKLTNIAGFLAICVALFPTGKPIFSNPQWVEWIHFGSASIFFIILGYISLFIFTKGHSLTKNRLFRISGIIIWLSISILVIYFLTNENFNWPEKTVFWFETICLWAFGTSWLAKGKALTWIGIK